MTQHLHCCDAHGSHPSVKLTTASCADGHTGGRETAAAMEAASAAGTGRRIMKPETAAFRASFTQAAAAAAGAVLVDAVEFASVTNCSESTPGTECCMSVGAHASV